MRVKDLKSILSTLPDEVIIVVNGYEDGVDKVLNVDGIMVKEYPEVNEKPYYSGKFIRTESGMTSAVYFYADRKY